MSQRCCDLQIYDVPDVMVHKPKSPVRSSLPEPALWLNETLCGLTFSSYYAGACSS